MEELDRLRAQLALSSPSEVEAPQRKPQFSQSQPANVAEGNDGVSVREPQSEDIKKRPATSALTTPNQPRTVSRPTAYPAATSYRPIPAPLPPAPPISTPPPVFASAPVVRQVPPVVATASPLPQVSESSPEIESQPVQEAEAIAGNLTSEDITQAIVPEAVLVSEGEPAQPLATPAGITEETAPAPEVLAGQSTAIVTREPLIFTKDMPIRPMLAELTQPLHVYGGQPLEAGTNIVVEVELQGNGTLASRVRGIMHQGELLPFETSHARLELRTPEGHAIALAPNEPVGNSNVARTLGDTALDALGSAVDDVDLARRIVPDIPVVGELAGELIENSVDQSLKALEPEQPSIPQVSYTLPAGTELMVYVEAGGTLPEHPESPQDTAVQFINDAEPSLPKMADAIPNYEEVPIQPESLESEKVSFI